MSGGAIRVICGVVIGAGTAWIVQKNRNNDRPNVVRKTPETGHNFLPLQKVLASWTTNFSPSVPWDDNWDRSVYCLCAMIMRVYVHTLTMK